MACHGDMAPLQLTSQQIAVVFVSVLVLVMTVIVVLVDDGEMRTPGQSIGGMDVDSLSRKFGHWTGGSADEFPHDAFVGEKVRKRIIL